MEYMNQNRSQVLEDIDQKAFNETLVEIESITVLDVVFDDILRKIIIGLFLSTILAVFLRK